MNQTSAQDAGPSPDIGDTTGLKPAAVPNNGKLTTQGDGDNNGDERDLFASQTTAEEQTTVETPLATINLAETPRTETSTAPSVTMIGPCFFNLPSENGMQVVLAAARTLQPIVNHITLQQRIQLARRITKSKCLVAAKELHLKREMFNATNSVKDLVDTVHLDSARVLAVLTTWRRTFFDQLTKRMNKQLAKKTAQHTNATKTGNNSYHAPARNSSTPAIVDLSNNDDDEQDTPPNKRKKPPAPNHAKRAKNTQDEQPAALHSSPTRQQHGHDDTNSVTRKPPTGGQAQRHVRINTKINTKDNEQSHARRPQQKGRQGQRKPAPRRQQQQQQSQQQQSQRQQQQSQRQQQPTRNNRKAPPPSNQWPAPPKASPKAPPKPSGQPPTASWGTITRDEWSGP
jgi:hypothetical protein